MKYLLVALATLLTPTLFSAPIIFDVSSYRSDGFRASVIHTATHNRRVVDGHVWYPGGYILGEVSGSIVADYDGTTLNFDGGSLEILAIDGPLGAYDLVISGGSLDIGDPAGGYLDYSITNGFDTFSTGTFHFAAHNWNGDANTVSDAGFDLWGQNFLKPRGQRGKDCDLPLGLDLHATAQTPVPEPTTVALLAFGAVGAAAMRKKRRNESQN